MNKRHLIHTIGIAVSTLLLGCDVTNNNSSSAPPTQEGDSVIVDFPIAYIERPVPFGLEDDNDIEPGFLSENIFDPTEFRGGAKLYIKDRASVSAAARVITDDVFAIIPVDGTDPIIPPYDVRDLSVNPEGTKLAFSMRAPEIEGADDDEQPTWNIWEYDRETDSLTRIIESDVIAEEGHDRFPTFVPDGSIIFSSTRQRTSKSILLDQSRPQYAYVTELDEDARAFTLHRIDEDRAEIEQISFGKGHDIYATILDDGRVMYLRGDDTSNANDDRLSLYTMNPDGSNVSPEYGYHSPSSQDIDDPVQGGLIKPLQLPDGKIMVSYRPRESSVLGGDLYAVDTANYIDISTPTSDNLGATAPAEESLTFGEVLLEAQSPHGYFNSAFPLSDGTNRLLVSWMPCLVRGFRFDIYVNTLEQRDPDTDALLNTTYQLINAEGEFVNRSGDLSQTAVEISSDEVVSLPCDIENFGNDNIEPSEPQYGVWVYDPITETQDPVVLANVIGTIYTEAVVFEPKTSPSFIGDAAQDEFTLGLASENVGVLNIRSIYDFDGQDVTADGIAALADPFRTPTDTRPVRFIRFYEEANMPNEDDYEIDADLVGGRFNNPGRGVIGYAQVHPDGSVMTKLPANVQFAMEFVDADGRRVTGGFNIRHRNWLNVRPGEVRECNGCHSAASTAPHGRINAEPESAYPGALAEIAFTNTSLTDRFGSPYPPPQIGETMAEYYVRSKLADPGEVDDPLALSLDIVFTDEWTDPASGATPGADIALEFGIADPVTGQAGPDNLKTLPPVLIGECLSNWNALCRTVIDYPDHIQPMWEVARTAVIGGVEVDVTCLNCHSPLDVDGNAQVPAPDVGNLQLDFSPVISNLDDDMVFLKGYDEFFAADDPLFSLDPDTGALVPQLIPLIINGVPQYQMQQQTNDEGAPLFEATNLAGDTVCVPLDTTDPDVTLVVDAAGLNVQCLEIVFEVDADGNPVLDASGNPIPVPILVANVQGRYLNAQGANSAQNQRFFEVFAPGANHEGYLTPAELKLFSEWLDGGGQYYNEIFKALDD